MNGPIWVLESIAVAVHQMLLAEHGGSPGVRDHALLDSALARPQQRFAYQPDSTLFELAAAYSYGIARNHPFIDGNKRVALAVGAVFLELNGFTLDAPEPEAVITFEQLAAGNITEMELADWFEKSSGTQQPSPAPGRNA
ncbi:type II toxin-antitoxin system death-on-curing family toxin [Candidatus Thiothrix sp. Deng01]|uniref:Type II toxin-antitoxin system death-on-curing family toxin n=1 Tax=Candidatus Thiothrix phosphatis TaxID=3112415 RepID=A0ABU6D2Y7_9GAMM|nr:type II toxin-antitoxin system death-on-curing family toxin [Candidatus Thiothrix sp. Deng01]MEB4593177.1 type II toxin-antitoxin system death-on-curing family toxin [Candidatus Thiothrix sp. Deng01]